MSQQTKAELAMFKPLSRFVEHFDLMPPTELLDTSSVEIPDEPAEQRQTKKSVQPLYALPNDLQRNCPSNLSIQSAEPLQTSAIMYSPTSPTTDVRDYYKKLPVSTTTEPSLINQPPSDVLRSVGRSRSNPVYSTTANSTNDINKSDDPSSTIAKVVSPTFEDGFTNPVIVPSSNSNTKATSNQDYTSPSSGKSKLSRNNLNKSDIIIRRYDAWSKFLTLVVSWVGEIARLGLQSKRSFSSLLKEARFSNLRGSNIESANGIHAAIHGFTADLALQEQQFGQRLKEHVPLLEKFKKECTIHTKGLKQRSDLAMDEFLRRAEVTANLMVQLSKTCKDARRTIEKGGQLTNDPWLANLYVLRQLKREVDEENRLRRLMVPIQQTLLDFETRLLKQVEETIKVCFERPGSLTEERLNSLEASLNTAVCDNWNTFALNNKKDIVNEKNPNKHYLKINYPFKNDPLVTTLHKGELERKSGVLNKYIQRFFVLTESGFLHQFKLNEKVSPEFSIYIPNATIVPNMDISHLNLTTLQSEPEKSSSFSFEIQRSGSVLQRDKSYVFRTLTLAEMVVWCKLLSDIATRPIDSVLQPRLQFMPHTAMSGVSSVRSSMVITDNNHHQNIPQHQETTPPPSPIQQLPETLQIKINRMSSVTDDIPQYVMEQPTVSPTGSTELYMPTMIEDQISSGRHKQYTPQLKF